MLPGALPAGFGWVHASPQKEEGVTSMWLSKTYFCLCRVVLWHTRQPVDWKLEPSLWTRPGTAAPRQDDEEHQPHDGGGPGYPRAQGVALGLGGLSAERERQGYPERPPETTEEYQKSLC